MCLFLYDVRDNNTADQISENGVTAQGHDETNLGREIFNNLKKTYNSIKIS